MTAIIMIRGFTEDDSESTGTEDVFFDIVRKFANDDVTTFHPLNWNHDFDSMVRILDRYCIDKLILIGYSWGAGYGCVKLAKKLRKTKVNIISCLMCDPVYRPSWIPAWMGILPFLQSLNTSRRIKIPTNIKKTRWVRQFLSIPRGHDLDGFNISRAKVLQYSHAAIDSSPEWRAMVKDELERLLTEQTP